MAAHRYWRIDITAVIAPQTNINMAEIQMASSVGGANLFGSGTAFGSSEQGGLTYAAACDGDVTTWWSTPDPSLGWWGYDFGGGSPVSVTEVRITVLYVGGNLYAPTAFTLDYSDDGSTWTTVQAFTASTWTIGQTQTFDVDVDVSMLRASQVIAEALITTPTAALRASQVVAEALMLAPVLAPAPLRASQVIAEALISTPTPLRASQFIAEALVVVVPPPAPGAGEIMLTGFVPAGGDPAPGALVFTGFAPPTVIAPAATPAIFGDLDYQAALAALMPRGIIWRRDPESLEMATLGALAPTYTRTTAAAARLLIDAFPSTTFNLLSEWESSLGLPDPCTALNPTIAQRQAAVRAKFGARGVLSKGFFIALAAELGFTITIDEFRPFVAGDPVGGPLYGAIWAFVWQVNAPQIETFYFSAGTSSAGDPLTTYDAGELVCRIRENAPAETTVIFAFS